MSSETSPDTAAVAWPGPTVGESTVTFRLHDPEHRLVGVRLLHEVPTPGAVPDFRPTTAGWELTLDRPPVVRMEYRFALTHPGGGVETVLDPGNPVRVGGAFGDKSVLEFPGYRPPAWLGESAPPGRLRAFEVPARSLGAAVNCLLWCPADLVDEVAVPLLVVHDGPEYDRLAALTHYLAAGVTGGWLPALRAALLAPGERNRWYSANDAYASALGLTVVPTLTGVVPTTTCVGMGTSLGALAMVHAQRGYPEVFDALFLQSGSFFHPRYDAHEYTFAYYRHIVRFVSSVLAATTAPRAVPAVLVCGAVEENVENNRLMASTLRRQGYDATLSEVPDVHNYVAWRDAFDPHLTGLLARAGQAWSSHET